MILNNKDKLLEVVDKIMTDMFFIFPDMNEEGEQLTEGVPSTDNIKVGIHFNTEHYLLFNMDRALLKEMAANFMGLMPDDIEEEHLHSMATETANIIGGNYLVEIDPERECKLSIPRILEEDIDVSEAEWQVVFVSEGNVLCITPIKRKDF